MRRYARDLVRSLTIFCSVSTAKNLRSRRGDLGRPIIRRGKAFALLLQNLLMGAVTEEDRGCVLWRGKRKAIIY